MTHILSPTYHSISGGGHRSYVNTNRPIIVTGHCWFMCITLRIFLLNPQCVKWANLHFQVRCPTPPQCLPLSSSRGGGRARAPVTVFPHTHLSLLMPLFILPRSGHPLPGDGRGTIQAIVPTRTTTVDNVPTSSTLYMISYTNNSSHIRFTTWSIMYFSLVELANFLREIWLLGLSKMKTSSHRSFGMLENIEIFGNHVNLGVLHLYRKFERWEKNIGWDLLVYCYSQYPRKKSIGLFFKDSAVKISWMHFLYVILFLDKI